MNPKPKFEDYRFEIRPIPADEGGGFLVSLPDLPGCMSDGDTFDQAIANAREAFDAWIASHQELGREIPVAGGDVRPAKFLLRLARSTHQELSTAASVEGVSLNTLVSILIAEALGYRAGRSAGVRESVRKGAEQAVAESLFTTSGVVWRDVLETTAQETDLVAFTKDMLIGDSWAETGAREHVTQPYIARGRGLRRRGATTKRRAFSS